MRIMPMRTVALASCLVFCAVGYAGATEPTHPPLPEAARPHVEVVRHAGEPPRVRTCFSAAETREKVVSRRLSEPFRLLRGAAGRVQGEALRARLCRWNEDYVYEIALLRRDGHIVHVYLNAVSGQSVAAFDER